MRTRGQVSAPFELIVAIVVMGFVIVAGSAMWGSAQCQICKSNVSFEISELAGVIETVATERSTEEIFFSPQKCYDVEPSTKVYSFDEEAQCFHHCGTATKSCLVLIFYAPSNSCGSVTAVECLKIPPNTVFETSKTTCDPNNTMNAYELKNFTENIPAGTYVLKERRIVGSANPKICAFYKVA